MTLEDHHDCRGYREAPRSIGGGTRNKKVLLNHSIQEPVFGVKIEELKKFQKRIRKDYRLALDLYSAPAFSTCSIWPA